MKLEFRVQKYTGPDSPCNACDLHHGSVCEQCPCEADEHLVYMGICEREHDIMSDMQVQHDTQ